jgi:hypothetical protein
MVVPISAEQAVPDFQLIPFWKLTVSILPVKCLLAHPVTVDYWTWL